MAEKEVVPKENPQVKKEKKKSFNINISFGSVSGLNIALSIRHLSLMLKSGLSLSESIGVLAEQTVDARLKKAYQEIAISIEGGMNLSDSMKQHPKIFTGIVTSMVNVGEQGGTLEKNLIFLAEYLRKANDLNKKVKSALIYPGIVFTMTVVEMLGVIFFILPKLEELFKSFENIPPFTVSILKFSSFIRTNSTFLGLGILGFIIGLMLFLKTKPGKRFKDILGLNFPVIKKLNQNNILATFSRTVSILLESGIPLANSLNIASETIGNSIYKKALITLHEDVKSGKNLADALAKYKNLFPATYVKMIEVGEKTGTLQDNLTYLYDYHANEVEEMSNNLTQLLEPILLIFIGAMIGFLALIIIGPIYQFTGSINSSASPTG